MNILIDITVFIVGAMFGSAANALVDRLPRNESWFAGRSHCDKCKHTLEWYDLVPVVAYLALRGRCRYCRSPIPRRNLTVEIFLGASFVLLTTHYSLFNPQTIILMAILWVTTIIAVMDWETKLVSEVMVGVWGILVIVNQLTSLPAGQAGLPVAQLSWGSYSVGLIIGLGVIGGLWAVSRGKAMGFGDVEIAAVMGWWLGWPVVAPAIWIAFVSGAVVGSYELIVHKKKMKSEIAFGPFLVLGAWGGLVWGENIIKLLGGTIK